jgi:hypothetical protein
LGVETIAPFWEFGNIRLPMKGNQSRVKSLQLIKEVTHYSGEPPDDLIMSEWFMHFNMPKIYRPPTEAKRMWRPGWVRTGGNDKPSRGMVALYAGKH